MTDFGTLHLSTEAPAAAQAVAWGDIPEMRALTVASALMILFLLPELYKMAAPVAGCLIRARGNIEVEHNLSTARSRNFCARMLLFPFILAASRYSLYTPSFLPSASMPWAHLGQLAGVVLAYLVLRRICHALIAGLRPTRLGSDENRAVTRGFLNYFIFFSFISLPTVCLMHAFSAADSAVRMILWAELALSWVVSIIREAQILHLSCSGLGTFLYLCGLEFLPAAALVASGLVL